VQRRGGYEDGTEPSPGRGSGYPGSRGLSDREGGVAETTEEGSWTCERCGAVRPANWTCSCGGDGKGDRIVPEGWNPDLTRTSRPRLGLIARPDPPQPKE
jgi:hypothetical protein